MNKILLLMYDYFMRNTLDVLSFIVTIVGFAIVIIDTKKSKKEIKNARKEIFKNNASNDLSILISNLEEIKRKYRSLNTTGLLELYSNLRKLIISIKALYPDLIDKQKIILQRAMQFIIEMENSIEKKFREDPNFQIFPEETSNLSEQIDILYELSLELRIREDK